MIKNKYLSMMLLAIISLPMMIACGDDNEDVIGKSRNNFIGSWKLVSVNNVEVESIASASYIQFKEEGLLTILRMYKNQEVHTTTAFVDIEWKLVDDFILIGNLYSRYVFSGNYLTLYTDLDKDSPDDFELFRQVEKYVKVPDAEFYKFSNKYFY